MDIIQQISNYIAGIPQAKQADMQTLHQRILQILPDSKLWFDNGKNREGKVVANPSIGYGSYPIKYANGDTKEFYQTGISANTSGISVYIMGINDKTWLPQTFGKEIGKATVTGYCVKFKKLADINIDVLETAIRSGVELTGGK